MNGIAAGVIAFGLVWLYQAFYYRNLPNMQSLGLALPSPSSVPVWSFGAILAFQIYRGVPLRHSRRCRDLLQSRSSLARRSWRNSDPDDDDAWLRHHCDGEFRLTTRAFQSRRYVNNTVIGATLPSPAGTVFGCWAFRLRAAACRGLIMILSTHSHKASDRT